MFADRRQVVKTIQVFFLALFVGALPGFFRTRNLCALLGATAEWLLPANVEASEREITFQGQPWVVKVSQEQVGPGPNYFSASPENVFVDAKGRLHLRIVRRAGRWYSAEVISRRTVGYGTYRFEVEQVNPLDPNAVLGAFTWGDESGPHNNEIDALEVGHFGDDSGYTNAQVVIQPAEARGNLQRFLLPHGGTTTHIMHWEPEGLQFQAAEGDGPVIHEWSYPRTVPNVSGEKLHFRFNLWLFQGRPPSGKKEVEVIITSFSFEPALSTPRITS
ncbi:MAG: glycoside hydrolase family 16 protein [Bryobacterales bacterium]|nr:glycoside hydrolase family 16 protein [Bryobacterales bacterium]